MERGRGGGEGAGNRRELLGARGAGATRRVHYSSKSKLFSKFIIFRVITLSYMLLHQLFEFIYELYIIDRGISIEIRLEA